jgi:hypothetical protein
MTGDSTRSRQRIETVEAKVGIENTCYRAANIAFLEPLAEDTPQQTPNGCLCGQWSSPWWSILSDFGVNIKFF